MASRFSILSILAVVHLLQVSAGSATSAEPAKKKDAVAEAIKKGTQYLINAHRPDAQYGGGSNGIGTACLAGLALLESGVDEKNASLHNIIKLVRAGCMQETSTYHLSLAIMFLDRLGHPQDQGLIQFLGIRLLAGQTEEGGWSYNCIAYPLTAQEETRLRNAFAKDAKLTNHPRHDIDKEDAPKKESAPAKEVPALHPEVGKLLNQGQGNRKRGELMPKFPGRKGGFGLLGAGDNSNTQFAALGLWCARKHGLPIEKAMQLLEQRFRLSQLDDGGWSYIGAGQTTATMTCAGLIGLAVSFGSSQAVLKNKRGADVKEGPEKGGRDLGDDAGVKKGLKRLGEYITDAKNMGGNENLPDAMKGRRGLGGEELGHNLYFLWSVERVAVIFGLETIGKNDWYDWGSKNLIESQFGDGSWSSNFPGGAAGDVSTPLALLFLNRANVAKDLTATIRGKVRDPGVSMLKSGGDISKILPGVKKDPVAKDTPAPPPKESKAPAPKAADPAVEFEKQASRLANDVILATGEQQVELLNHLRDSKGAIYTEALTRVATKLSGQGQTLAREALARRFMRMTPTTLREMLRDDHEEVRRAAAAACALKNDKQYLPDLIDLLADKNALVVDAAHASLKAITGADFGPETGSTDSERTKAILAWRTWMKTKHD